MAKIYSEPEKKLSVIGNFDVVVVGGGFAGVTAALAAARDGAGVCLVEKSCSMGGLGTLGLVVDYLPLCDGRGTQLIGGIGEELMLGVSKYDRTRPPECWQNVGSESEKSEKRYMLTYNPAAMELYMEEALLKENVTVVYDTLFCGVLTEENRIGGIIVENKSGRSVIEGKMFVDATGDADVCVAAGEEYVESDRNVCAWWFYTAEDGKNTLHRMSENFYQIREGSRTYKVSDYKDVTALVIDSRNRIRDCLAKDASAQPLLISHIPQFRMTRRIVGRETVGEEDDGRWFETCVGMSGDWRKRGPRFCVPFGAICPKNTVNLLTAGRCISTTDSGWDIMRVIPACAVTGEAAGSAAAMAAKGECDIGRLSVSALQQHLKERGVIIEKSYMSR